jgi:hypothetical protein
LREEGAKKLLSTIKEGDESQLNSFLHSTPHQPSPMKESLVNPTEFFVDSPSDELRQQS